MKKLIISNSNDKLNKYKLTVIGNSGMSCDYGLCDSYASYLDIETNTYVVQPLVRLPLSNDRLLGRITDVDEVINEYKENN